MLFKSQFQALVNIQVVLKSYVDDIFGDAVTKAHAAYLIAELIAEGNVTTAVMNLLKFKGPAKVMEILGLLFDDVLRKVAVPLRKRNKISQ